MFGRAAEIHRLTAKPRDIPWNRFVMRPIASFALVAIERTRLAPNQLTLGSLALFVLSLVIIAVAGGRAGLVLGVLLLELSYALDCADGQLARLKTVSTPVGAHLDFVMDEIKALALVAAIGVGIWLQGGSPLYVVESAMGAAIVGTGLALTTFMRRPEYQASTHTRVSMGAGDYGQGFAAAAEETAQPRADLAHEAATRAREAERPRRLTVIAMAEKLGQFVIHYPSHIWLFALAGRIDIFLHLFLFAHAGHAARSLAVITRRLGGFLPRASEPPGKAAASEDVVNPTAESDAVDAADAPALDDGKPR